MSIEAQTPPKPDSDLIYVLCKIDMLLTHFNLQEILFATFRICNEGGDLNRQLLNTENEQCCTDLVIFIDHFPELNFPDSMPKCLVQR